MEINQLYHLEPPYGLMNDPNAFIKFKGTYYLFCQWNPTAKDHSLKEWGYFSSTDLINWNFCGKAIKANSFYDREGVYSGTGVVYDDKIYLYYTGNIRPGGKRKSYQNLVTSEDGQTFIKEGILFPTPAGFTEHIRDPKVFIYNNNFYMLLAAQKDQGNGTILLFTSPNPTNFIYLKVLAETQEYEMVECPDMVIFGDKALLNYALQKRDNEADKDLYAKSYYKVVTYDFKTNQLSDGDLDSNKQLIDEGFDFYVPQTLQLDDGRVIMVGWMSNMTKEEALVYFKDSYYAHCFTMFREIEINGTKLIQRPLKEYETLLGKEITLEDGSLKFNKRQFKTEFNFKDLTSLCIKINDEFDISFNRDEKAFSISRLNWLSQKRQTKAIELDHLDKLEIWSDTSSIELYINDGEFALSSRIVPEEVECRVDIKADGKFDYRANELNV